MEHEYTQPVPAVDPVRTAEQPAVTGGWVAVPTAASNAVLAIPDEDEEDWMASPAAPGMRLRVPTVILLALGLVAAGFWTGAVVQKHNGTTTSPAVGALAARLRAGGFGRAGAGAAGAGGVGLGGAGLTRGTVIDVAGDTVSVSDAASGAIDKVQIGASTTITRSSKGGTGNLQVGDTVVVRGSAGAGGVIDATAIVASAQGLAATGSGG